MRALRRACLGLLALSLAVPAWPDAGTGAALRIEQPWSRATPPLTPVAVGYLAVVNESGRTERLLGASSPLAARVTIHRSVEAEGMTRMQPQPDGVVIPAGARVVLEPGGLHLMLMQLERPLRAGDRVPVTLRFEHAGPIEVELRVRALGEGFE